MSQNFSLGTKYTRAYIAGVLGGDPISYLPQDSTGRVVAGCYRPDLNPDVPDIVLPGSGNQIESSAREYCNGRYAIPTFVKLTENEWIYVGMYFVKGSTGKRAWLRGSGSGGYPTPTKSADRAGGGTSG